MSYSTIVRFCLASIAAATIAAGYGFLYGIPLHFIFGNTPAVIAHEVSNALSFWAGIVCLSLAVLSLANLVTIIINRQAYERNCQASQLLKNALKGTLNEEEQKLFTAMRAAGVLTYNSHGQLRLSDQAIDDVFPL